MIKDNENKECYIVHKVHRDQRLYKKVTYKKKKKEKAINEIQKWKKDTIDQIVEKQGLKPKRVIDPYFCIFLD